MGESTYTNRPFAVVGGAYTYMTIRMIYCYFLTDFSWVSGRKRYPGFFLGGWVSGTDGAG